MKRSNRSLVVLLVCQLAATAPAWGRDDSGITAEWFFDALFGDYFSPDSPEEMIELDIEENRLEHAGYDGSSRLDLTQEQIDQYNARRSKETDELLADLAKALKEAAKPCPNSDKLKKVADAIGAVDAKRNLLESKAKIITVELIHMGNSDDSSPDPRKAARLAAWKRALQKLKEKLDEALEDARKKLDEASRRAKNSRFERCDKPSPASATGSGMPPQQNPTEWEPDQQAMHAGPSLEDLRRVRKGLPSNEPRRSVHVLYNPNPDDPGAIARRDVARRLGGIPNQAERPRHASQRGDRDRPMQGHREQPLQRAGERSTQQGHEQPLRSERLQTRPLYPVPEGESEHEVR